MEIVVFSESFRERTKARRRRLEKSRALLQVAKEENWSHSLNVKTNQSLERLKLREKRAEIQFIQKCDTQTALELSLEVLPASHQLKFHEQDEHVLEKARMTSLTSLVAPESPPRKNLVFPEENVVSLIKIPNLLTNQEILNPIDVKFDNANHKFEILTSKNNDDDDFSNASFSLVLQPRCNFTLKEQTISFSRHFTISPESYLAKVLLDIKPKMAISKRIDSKSTICRRKFMPVAKPRNSLAKNPAKSKILEVVCLSDEKSDKKPAPNGDMFHEAVNALTLINPGNNTTKLFKSSSEKHVETQNEIGVTEKQEGKCSKKAIIGKSGQQPVSNNDEIIVKRNFQVPPRFQGQHEDEKEKIYCPLEKNTRRPAVNREKPIKLTLDYGDELKISNGHANVLKKPKENDVLKVVAEKSENFTSFYRNFSKPFTLS